MKILNIVGARPNFMKVAPVITELNNFPKEFDHKLVHTGQHYDRQMSTAFFNDLDLPIPDIELNAGSGSHAEQTAKIMMKFEKVCTSENPDLVIVYGDVNSTLACSITAKKLGLRVAHVEAGLRSRDITMPEEINRLCTDAISDLLFTTDKMASENLQAEGVPSKRIYFVGNVMIDTLLKHKSKAKHKTLLKELDLRSQTYGLVTLHRPSNVDEFETLERLLTTIRKLSEKFPIIFPIHPRTKSKLTKFRLLNVVQNDKIHLLEPLGYLDFLHLTMNAKLVMTDSGGLQEETTVLGVPCLTIRDNTERPITCFEGTNTLVGNNPNVLMQKALHVMGRELPRVRLPEKWDGSAGSRIVKILRKFS